MTSQSLPELQEQLASSREIVLANALMLGEIPAPTGEETQRAGFLMERFLQCSNLEVSTDELGNVEAFLPGKKGDKTILIASHVDTSLDITPDQRIPINIGSDAITGPGMADNTLGLAALASMPDLFSRLGLELDANLLLLGHVKSLGGQDLAGLKFFLKNSTTTLDAGLILEGMTLGRLNYSCLGMVQADIRVQVHHTPGSRWEASENAIIIMHRIIKRILEIPIPQEPRTSVIIGSISGGKTFNRPPQITKLRLEIRSEEPGKAREIRYRIQDILEEIAAETASECSIEFPALRKPGGISFNHPFVVGAREIQEQLGIQTMTGPSFSDLSALISEDIPAMTIGLSTVTNLNEKNETTQIEPLFQGLAQAVAMIQMVDTQLYTLTPELTAEA